MVPTIKLVKDVINNLKQVASSTAQRNEQVVQLMVQVREAFEADHDHFMDVFVEHLGIYQLQNCLRSLQPKVIQQVFEVVPHFFKFQSAREYIKGKLDFFTALYEFMDHEIPGLRANACKCFCGII